MATILITALYISLAIHVFLISIAVWQVWRGENSIDRLIGTDVVTTLMLAALALISLIFRDSIYIDVALGLGALSFISTAALAKFLADEKIF